MERIIDKEIAENIVKGNKIKAIKLLRERRLPFSTAYKIVTELKITTYSKQIQKVNNKIIDELNEEINREKDRLFASI